MITVTPVPLTTVTSTAPSYPGRSKRNSVSDRINGRSITDRNAVSYGSNTAVNRDWFGAP